MLKQICLVLQKGCIKNLVVKKKIKKMSRMFSQISWQALGDLSITFLGAGQKLVPC